MKKTQAKFDVEELKRITEKTVGSKYKWTPEELKEISFDDGG